MSSRSQFTTGASPSASWKNATCVLGILYHASTYHNFDITPTEMFRLSATDPYELLDRGEFHSHATFDHTPSRRQRAVLSFRPQFRSI
jgi:hypothetical protein